MFLFWVPVDSKAHVKWFADYQGNPEPAHWSLLLTPWLAVIILAGISMMYLLFLSQRLIDWQPAERLCRRLSLSHRHHLLLVAVLISMALCWQYGVIMAPELYCSLSVSPLIQVPMLVLGLFSRLRWLVPAGIVLLFSNGLWQYGLVHMLDYVFYLGIAAFLWFSRPTARVPRESLGMQWLYGLTGFSLCWVAMEKLVFPHWTEQVLAQAPLLSLGLPWAFFIQAAALVEFAIGFLLLTGQWTKTCALLLSLLMVSTATLFGLKEIMGHLPLHAVLLLILADRTSDRRSSSKAAFRQRLAFRQAGLSTLLFSLSLVMAAFTHYTLAWWRFQGQG